MIPTPHIGARLDEIAETVLMPGDPLRARFIAENFLENAIEYNSVRGMLGYTGMYKGKRISVQGSGMGIPSIGIYSYELFNFYNIENIIRIGTAGSIHDDLKVKDIVIAQGASTDSNFADQFKLSGTYSAISSYELLEKAVKSAKEKGVNYKVGNVLSTDVFYSADSQALKQWNEMGILAVEMEAAGLFMNAAKSGKRALAIMTISDCIFTGVTTSSDQRQSAFTDMMEIALNTAYNL